MSAGRPRKVDPGSLYTFAHQFYWDLKSIQEGLFRVATNKELRDKLLREADAVQPSKEQINEFHPRFSRLVEKGYAAEADRERQAGEWAEDLKFHMQESARNHAYEVSRRVVKIPGEPDVVDDLLAATKPEQIVTICKDAFSTWPREIEPNVTRETQLPNWPIHGGSVLPMYLSQYAAEFIAAKNDPRFPKSSSRPSSRLKRLWFLSRALAGALYGIKCRTAINLVGSIRPDQAAEFSRATKPRRKITKVSRSKR